MQEYYKLINCPEGMNEEGEGGKRVQRKWKIENKKNHLVVTIQYINNLIKD